MQTANPPQLLRDIHAVLTALETTLEEEITILGRNDLEALADITREKHTLCRRLENLERDLREQGDLSRWRGLPLWREITTLFETCQRHNQRNGLVVVRKRHDVATLLTTLHGQQGEERGTYSRRGATSNGGSRGDLLASA